MVTLRYTMHLVLQVMRMRIFTSVVILCRITEFTQMGYPQINSGMMKMETRCIQIIKVGSNIRIQMQQLFIKQMEQIIITLVCIWVLTSYSRRMEKWKHLETALPMIWSMNSMVMMTCGFILMMYWYWILVESMRHILVTSTSVAEKLVGMIVKKEALLF